MNSETYFAHGPSTKPEHSGVLHCHRMEFLGEFGPQAPKNKAFVPANVYDCVQTARGTTLTLVWSVSGNASR